MGERYQQAADYIDQHIKSGVSDHAIREHFLQHGWTPHDVAQAFTLYSQSARHPTKLLYPKKKLTFFGVLRDISSAIFYNFPAYLTSIILLTVALIGYWSFMALFINEDASEWLIIIFAAFILAGFHSFQSIIFAIMSSLIKARYEKKKVHLLQPLKESIRALRRIALTNLLWNIITYGIPLIAIGIASLVAMSGSTAGYLVAILLGFVSTLWIIIIGIRFCLSPAIAQHELNVPIAKTFPRSRKLLGTRGQLIVVLGAIATFVAVLLATGSESENDWVINIQLLAMILIFSYGFGGFSAIYFNRVAHEKHR
jgi:hypothetical protein